jgi:hypothetical protein
LNVNKFVFRNYELIPYKKFFENEDNHRKPMPIILIFDWKEDNILNNIFAGFDVKYVSSLLSFVFGRKFKFCNFGMNPSPPNEYPENGNIGFIYSSCREIFGSEISYNNPKRFYLYAPQDESILLTKVKDIHEKIGYYKESERKVIYNCLYLCQLALILEEESNDLAFALLVICIESIANTEFFFA